MADYKILHWEVDSLQGNINRMCVTDDEKELLSMHEWALKRVERIFELRQADFHREVE